ncbi:MAG: hypothetical protein RBU27_01855 [Bacteroidota bacterium]|nr:hypothetical protein [Bacteroidota bacterium]
MKLLSLAVAMVFVAACSDDAAVVDFTHSESAILLTDIQLSRYIVDTDTVDVKSGQDKTASDPIEIPFEIRVRVLHPERVGTIRYEIRLDGKTALLHSGTLERTAEGFASPVRFARSRGDVGDYRIDILATDETGLTANNAHAKLRVMFGSKPPRIESVTAPDTVELQSQNVVFNIAAEVTDPSGLADIKQVFFNSFLPDGRPSSGNPFLLRDDGQPGSGDPVAGDGFYGIRVQMPPGTPTGEYRFEFRALDFSGLSSNVVIHKLIVR